VKAWCLLYKWKWTLLSLSLACQISLRLGARVDARCLLYMCKLLSGSLTYQIVPAAGGREGSYSRFKGYTCAM
jgi:hypothetical protein